MSGLCYNIDHTQETETGRDLHGLHNRKGCTVPQPAV